VQDNSPQSTHDTAGIQAELEATEFVESFDVDGPRAVVEARYQEAEAAANEAFAKHERLIAPLNSGATLEKIHADHAATLDRINTDTTLSPIGKTHKRDETKEALKEAVGNLREMVDSETDKALAAAPPMPGIAKPQTAEDMAMLRLELEALRNGSPKHVISGLRDAAKDGDAVRFHWLWVEHSRQLERCSPHWRPYINTLRSLGKLYDSVVLGTAAHHRARAANNMVGQVRHEFNVMATIAERDGFSEGVWSYGPNLNKPEGYASRRRAILFQ